MIDDAGCFCSGAEIYDPKTKSHLYSHALNTSLLGQLHKKIKAHNIYCEWYSTEAYGTELYRGNDSQTLNLQNDTTIEETQLKEQEEAHEDISQIHSQHLRIVPVSDCLELIIKKEIPITKLLLGVNRKNSGAILQCLAKEFTECDFAFAGFLPKPDWLFASVIPKKASKEEAFKFLLAHHNVKRSEVVAFGDSHSDEVFIRLAGLGVAMGNATDKLKVLADVITDTSDNNGVEKLLSLLS